jgi:hypothetical protein
MTLTGLTTLTGRLITAVHLIGATVPLPRGTRMDLSIQGVNIGSNKAISRPANTFSKKEATAPPIRLVIIFY